MAIDLTAVSKRLPPDLRVRVSEDADIERVVEFQNRWATPSSWMPPAKARRMHTVSPEPNRLTLAVEDRNGAIQAFQRELLPVLWAMARDVPSPTPLPEQPPPFDIARRMFFEGPGQDPPSTIYALRDGHPVAMTATVVKENGAAYTNFTGVARAERGKGLALAMKLRALRELRARGVKLFGTTNDEQNAAMRGINRKLGYKPEPPSTMYEKRFA